MCRYAACRKTSIVGHSGRPGLASAYVACYDERQQLGSFGSGLHQSLQRYPQVGLIVQSNFITKNSVGKQISNLLSDFYFICRGEHGSPLQFNNDIVVFIKQVELQILYRYYPPLHKQKRLETTAGSSRFPTLKFCINFSSGSLYCVRNTNFTCKLTKSKHKNNLGNALNGNTDESCCKINCVRC